MYYRTKRKHPELDIYYDFVEEFALRFPKLLEFLFRFEHGGYKISKAEQKARKKTLLKGGIADYGLFIQSGGYTMLWCEFKADSGKLTPQQQKTRDVMIMWGAKCVTCWSSQEGIAAVIEYLKL